MVIYADDSQLYITIKPTDEITNITTNIENCVADIGSWMSENKLKLNVGKQNSSSSQQSEQLYSRMLVSD